MSDSDLHLTCLRCGAPAALGPYGEGEHHEPIGRSSKGAGGTSDAVTEHLMLPFCRKCHRDRHLKEFTVERIGDGKVKITERNGKVSIAARPDPMTETEVGEFALAYPYNQGGAMTLRDAAQRLPYCEDRVLADLWHCGSIRQDEGKALEALAARAFRMRYAQYGQDWYGKAARYIGDETGAQVSAATVYDRYALAIALDACEWDLNMLRHVGPAALSAAGKVCNVPAAVEKVREWREDEHLCSREAIHLVRKHFQTDEDSREPLPAEQWDPCAACGGTGRIRRAT